MIILLHKRTNRLSIEFESFNIYLTIVMEFFSRQYIDRFLDYIIFSMIVNTTTVYGH